MTKYFKDLGVLLSEDFVLLIDKLGPVPVEEGQVRTHPVNTRHRV